MDKKFKIFVSIAIAILTLTIVVGSIMLVLFIKNGSQASSSSHAAKMENLEIVSLEEPLNSNLKIGEDGIPHIVRIAIGFEINKKDNDYKTFIEAFTTKQIIIRDTILSIIREETYQTINKEELGNKVREKINTLLETQIITNVYFNDFFVQ